jgi:hypothetical protein
MNRICTATAALLILLLPAPVIAQTQTGQVLTQHNDNQRTGANLNETELTVSTVSSGDFGLLFSLPVDGQIYAQPLYVPALDVKEPGSAHQPEMRAVIRRHNVLYVATMLNSVYAFDADDPSGIVVWKRTLGQPLPKNFMPMGKAAAMTGLKGFLDAFTKAELQGFKNVCGAQIPPANEQNTFNIDPKIGITSTPVIDLSSNTIYVVAKTQNQTNGEVVYSYALHALDLRTGDERPGSPAPIDNKIAVGALRFEPKMHLQRPGLLLANGMVYVAFGSHQDTPPYHGWILGFDARTLQLKASFSTTPNGEEGGIWQSGNGLAADGPKNGLPADAQSNIYAMTGNGPFDPEKQNFGDSFIKLDPNLNVVDFFTPKDFDDMDESDADLGSAGPLLLPNQLLVGGGKEGKFYLLDQRNMGHHVEDDQHHPLQTLQATQGVTKPSLADIIGAALVVEASFRFLGGDVGDGVLLLAVARLVMSTNLCGIDFHHIHGSPVTWNSPKDGQLVYVWGERDNLRAYKLDLDKKQFPSDDPSFASTFKDPDSGDPRDKFMPGGILSVSANGSMPNTGIVWASVPEVGDAVAQLTSGALHAFDAADVSHELWCGGVGTFAKFTAPTVVNGKVYLATFDNRLNVYGSGAHKGEAYSSNYKTESSPFIHGDYIYFRGTDDKLWKVGTDGRSGMNLGGYHTRSTPFVFGDYIYFQGEHDKLYQVNINNPNGDNRNLGGYKTKSSPFVSGDYVYFQGTDNQLWRVNTDGRSGMNLGGYHTRSTPFVFGDYVYFQGEHDKLYQVNINNPNGDNRNLGGYKTKSSPFVSGDYVYFQGTDNQLWRVNTDGSSGIKLGGYHAKSAPFVSDDYVYFQGTDDTLWRVYKDGTRGSIPGCHNTTKSSPFVIGDRIFFRGTDDRLLMTFE